MKDQRFKGKRILIFEGGARQSLPFIRAFKKLGCHVTVLCGSKLDVAYVSRLPNKKVLIDYDEEDCVGTENCLLDVINRGQYDVAVPMSDFAATAFSGIKERLQGKVNVICSSNEIMHNALDKLNVMDVCQKNDLPCPKTLLSVEKIEDILNSELKFPILIKPRAQSGARGLRVFFNEDELVDYAKTKELAIGDYVIQEYIPDVKRCFSSNLYVDKNGKIVSNFIYQSARWFPIYGGTGTLNIAVYNKEAVEYSSKLVSLFGLRGCCGVDFIEDPRDGKIKILEINPRPLACTKIVFLSGINVAKQILEDVFSEEVTVYDTYKTGMRVRMSQIDFLWFLKSPNRFKSKPNFFNILHTKDQLFSIDDPLPWFAFLFSGMKKYKKQVAKKSKFRS